jgi:hypothetical protein
VEEGTIVPVLHPPQLRTKPGRRSNKEVIGGAIILMDGAIEENERRKRHGTVASNPR